MQKQLLSIFMLAGLFLSAESKAQQTLNVSGHSARIGQYTFDYSIGEMSLVSTERANSLIITQGFLQPGAFNGNQSDLGDEPALSGISDQIRVYPNPTQNILHVVTEEWVVGDFALQLLDAAGRILSIREGQVAVGMNHFSLDLQSFAGGTYYLMLRKPGQDGQSHTYSYKIQKLN